MTTRTTNPKPQSNGGQEIPIPPAGPPPIPMLDMESRVATLEQQVAKLATAIAALLAQQMQPQVQQAILAQLTGSAETAETGHASPTSSLIGG